MTPLSDPQPRTDRNATLDIARLLAAFGIVLFHAGAPGRSIGYAALPFFLMLLIVLGLPAAAARPFGSFMTNRARRLLIPWGIWSALYGAVKLLEVGFTQKTYAQEFTLSMLLTGPALHLWFLPFAFVASLTLPPLVRLWPATTAGQSRMLGLLLVASFASLALQQGPPLSIPLAQWATALPALGIGVALGLSRGNTALTIGAALGIFLLGTAAFALGWTTGLLQLGLASAALLLCLAVQSRETALSRLCAQTSLTVYLVHPLILSILRRSTNLDEHSLATAGAAMIVSLMFAYGLFHATHLWRTSGVKGTT